MIRFILISMLVFVCGCTSVTREKGGDKTTFTTLFTNRQIELLELQMPDGTILRLKEYLSDPEKVQIITPYGGAGGGDDKPIKKGN